MLRAHIGLKYFLEKQRLPKRCPKVTQRLPKGCPKIAQRLPKGRSKVANSLAPWEAHLINLQLFVSNWCPILCPMLHAHIGSKHFLRPQCLEWRDCSEWQNGSGRHFLDELWEAHLINWWLFSSFWSMPNPLPQVMPSHLDFFLNVWCFYQFDTNFNLSKKM